MRHAVAAIVVCAALGTAGCGVKGPLYYPNVPRDAPWPYAKPKPAAPPAPAAPASSAPSAPEAPGAPPVTPTVTPTATPPAAPEAAP